MLAPFPRGQYQDNSECPYWGPSLQTTHSQSDYHKDTDTCDSPPIPLIENIECPYPIDVHTL